MVVAKGGAAATTTAAAAAEEEGVVLEVTAVLLGVQSSQTSRCCLSVCTLPLAYLRLSRL